MIRFSMTSHLPHLIVYNLIKTVLDFQNMENIIQFSAGDGDFSRTLHQISWERYFF